MTDIAATAAMVHTLRSETLHHSSSSFQTNNPISRHKETKPNSPPPPRLKSRGYSESADAHLELALGWRLVFAISSFACPTCYALYGVTGDSWYRTLGAALIPLCLCLILVFWLGAPRDNDAFRRREKVNIAGK